jgi:hypothetical protein
MSERSHWRTVRTQHLVDQQPLDREQVENIVRFVDGKVEDYEERLPGCFWHSTFPPFPEGWTEEVPHPDETVIELASGSVRCPAHPAPCEYVRVCDENGDEVVYYDKQEWIDEPVDVMGALLGAMRMLSSDDDLRIVARGGVSVVNARDIPAVMRVGRQGEDEHKIILPPLNRIRGVEMWQGDAHIPAPIARRLAMAILAALREVDDEPQDPPA